MADHPDAKVKEHAAPLVKKLRGASEAKDAIIGRLLPEVSKPGNSEINDPDPPIVVSDDIPRTQVTVDDALLVGSLQPF